MKIRNLFMALLVMFFIGCGENNSESPASTVTSGGGTVVENDPEDNDNTVEIDEENTVTLIFIDGTNKELTENSQAVSIEVRAVGNDNSPYNEGEIKVAYPDKVLNGVDIGSFAASSVALENGKAVFSYTGPKDLQSRVDAGDTGTVFGFYHSANPESLKNFAFTYEPQANQIVLTDYELIETSETDTNVTMELESTRQFSYAVKDSQGISVADNKVTLIRVELLNPGLADLKDTFGTVADVLTFTNKNSPSISVQTQTRSGILPIKVTANFIDVNGDAQVLEEIFNVVVLSGPPTAISISYASTSQDAEHAKFEEHLVVTVTDKYMNYVNTQPAISASVIAGYEYDGADGTTRLYFEPDDAATATLNPTTDMFSAIGRDFSKVDESNEILATFGKGYTYNASGKWDFTRNNTTSVNQLKLIDNFDASANVLKLGYALGFNYRQDRCRSGQEWVGTIETEDGTDKLAVNGMAKLKLNYDYYLAGKDVVVAVNIIGYTAKTDTTSRIGEAQKITLRSTGLEAPVAEVPAGATNIRYRIPIKITNTGEYYRNADFGYKIKFSDNVVPVGGLGAVSQIGSRLANGTFSGTCDVSPSGAGSGVAYLDVNVTEIQGKAGTITVSEIVASEEF
jgi:hypothetical protein